MRLPSITIFPRASRRCGPSFRKRRKTQDRGAGSNVVPAPRGNAAHEQGVVGAMIVRSISASLVLLCVAWSPFAASSEPAAPCPEDAACRIVPWYFHSSGFASSEPGTLPVSHVQLETRGGSVEVTEPLAEALLVPWGSQVRIVLAERTASLPGSYTTRAVLTVVQDLEHAVLAQGDVTAVAAFGLIDRRGQTDDEAGWRDLSIPLAPTDGLPQDARGVVVPAGARLALWMAVETDALGALGDHGHWEALVGDRLLREPPIVLDEEDPCADLGRSCALGRATNAILADSLHSAHATSQATGTFVDETKDRTVPLSRYRYDSAEAPSRFELTVAAPST